MSETDWVLVPREPDDSMMAGGFESAAFEQHMDSVVASGGKWLYDCREAAEFVTAIYSAMIANAPSAPQGGGVLWVGGQPDETGMWAAYATREECLSHCASATPYTAQPRTDAAPGCGACADGCKDRGSCRVRDESPQSAPEGVVDWVKTKRELLSARLSAGRFHAQEALDMTMLSRIEAFLTAALAQDRASQPAAPSTPVGVDEWQCRCGLRGPHCAFAAHPNCPIRPAQAALAQQPASTPRQPESDGYRQFFEDAMRTAKDAMDYVQTHAHQFDVRPGDDKLAIVCREFLKAQQPAAVDEAIVVRVAIAIYAAARGFSAAVAQEKWPNVEQKSRFTEPARVALEGGAS